MVNFLRKLIATILTRLTWKWHVSGKKNSPFITSRKYLSKDMLAGFDPNEISWVRENLGVTNFTGALRAMENGHFIVNTAEEFHTPDIYFKEVIDPRRGHDLVKNSLDLLAEVIHGQLINNERKVVVHCQMGMERSVLAVVWYLYKYQDLSIDEAYEMVRGKRPIALDRRGWAIGVHE